MFYQKCFIAVFKILYIIYNIRRCLYFQTLYLILVWNTDWQMHLMNITFVHSRESSTKFGLTTTYYCRGGCKSNAFNEHPTYRGAGRFHQIHHNYSLFLTFSNILSAHNSCLPNPHRNLSLNVVTDGTNYKGDRNCGHHKLFTEIHLKSQIYFFF